MKINIFDSDFNGYLIKSTCKTQGLGISLENDEDKFEPSLDESIKTYNRILTNYLAKHTELDLYLILNVSKSGNFNAIDKQKGIWNNLKKEGITFLNATKEIQFFESGKACFVAYSKVEKEEISKLFKINNSIVCFTMETTIHNLFNERYRVLGNMTKIKEYLLQKDCLLVELLNLGYDGNSLFLYAQQDSETIKNLKSFIQEFFN